VGQAKKGAGRSPKRGVRKQVILGQPQKNKTRCRTEPVRQKNRLVGRGVKRGETGKTGKHPQSQRKGEKESPAQMWTMGGQAGEGENIRSLKKQ